MQTNRQAVEMGTPGEGWGGPLACPKVLVKRCSEVTCRLGASCRLASRSEGARLLCSLQSPDPGEHVKMQQVSWPCALVQSTLPSLLCHPLRTAVGGEEPLSPPAWLRAQHLLMAPVLQGRAFITTHALLYGTSNPH